ncbi:MAG: hypothetical protein AAGB01_09350, partial [Cyanobacteria bacterium P01_F01_bin.42]
MLPLSDSQVSSGSQESSDTSIESDLMSLVAEFPDAFLEPQELTQELTVENTGADSDEAAPATRESPSAALEVPSGYEMALHQNLSTFGWGDVDVFFRYGDAGLQSIWILVGKSGTEVQSFCEAIARLTNRLLAAGTPVSELVKELRGIRGGDSGGLGPHRFL